MQTINVTIVSGCLALQNESHGSVTEDELFHQLIKKEIEKKYNISIRITIIHYERFSTCFNKLVTSLEKYPADLLLFQTRGHHYLRLIKLLGKYLNYQKIWKWNINLPFIKLNNYEKYPPELISTLPKGNTFKENIESNRFLKSVYYNLRLNYMENLNYHIGALIGNISAAKKRYITLIKEVINLSKKYKIPVIFIGVVSRPDSKVQDYYSKDLNQSLKNLISSYNLPYIDIFGNYNQNGQFKFYSDNLHLNKIGHKEIAEKLLPFISQLSVIENLFHSPLPEFNI